MVLTKVILYIFIMAITIFCILKQMLNILYRNVDSEITILNKIDLFYMHYYFLRLRNSFLALTIRPNLT